MSTAVASARSNVTNLRRMVPDWAWAVVFLALAVLYPYILDQLLATPDDLLDASIQTLAYIIMALGLNIVVGFAGLLDLGYVAFFAIGAFVMGWLGSQQFPDVNGGKGIHILTPAKSAFGSALPGIHINFFFVIFIAAIFTALWGVILGAPTLRLRGDYLAIVTLAFGEIVPRIFENSTSGIFGIGSIDFSNGRQGITPIDKVNLPWTDEKFKYPLELKPIYFVGLAMVLLVIFFNRRLRDSRMGRAWIAVREDEVAAAAMGVNLVRTKLWAYALGAALGGFAGVFLATYNNTVNVDQFEFGFSVLILSMVIIGGMGNIWGVILGAIALSMFNRYGLKQLNGVPDKFGLDFDVTAINFGIFGFFLLVMMVLRPEGFIPSVETQTRAPRRGRRVRPHRGGVRPHALRRPRGPMTEQVAQPPAPAPADGGGTLLEATNISKIFGGLVAVNDITFTVPQRAIVSLIGPNGAGKTTFFNCMTGPLQADHGARPFQRQRHHGQAPGPRHAGRRRAHVPEHQAVPDDDVDRERAGRDARAAALARQRDGAAHAVQPARGEGVLRQGARAAELRGAQAPQRAGHEPAVRRSAPAGDRARAGLRSTAAAARRANGRDEPERVRAAAPAHGDHAQRAWHLGAAHRARHEGRDERLRSHHGARSR